jgi:predicted PurR-regulated permease PerM
MRTLAARWRRLKVARRKGRRVDGDREAAMNSWSPPLWFDRLAAVAWRLIVIAAALAGIVALIIGLGVIVLPIVLGLLFASALRPIAAGLTRLGAGKVLSAAGAVLVLVGFVCTVAYVSIRAIADQWDEISAALTRGVETLVDAAVDIGIARPVAENAAAQLSQATSSGSNLLVNGWINIVPYIATFVATLVLSVFVAFFFLTDGPLMWRWIVSHISDDSEVLDDVGRGVWTTVSSFMLGQTVIAAIDAVFIGLGAVVLGVPNSSAIFMLTFLGAFVPYIGAFITGLVAVLLAIADGGIAKGLAMLAIVIVVQIVEGNVLQPWIQGRAVKLHPLVVALAVTAGGALAGFLGILLAVPVCAATVVTMGQLRDAGLVGTRRTPDPVP